MMTLVKKIFTWWNVDTFGTRLKTIFFGKYAGSDSFGNKYYESKNGKRWVIYSDEIDASKIPVEWYSWMHFTTNKIEKNMNWINTIGKNHISLTLRVLIMHIIQIKIKKMLDKKNIEVGNLIKLFINFIIYISFTQITYAQTGDNFIGTNTDIKILDKISSKNELIRIINSEETIYKDLAIRVMKCTNSELDDNPEIKAYIQVRDLTKKDNDKVFVFNGWMFSSSPSIAPFDHPVYDIWLVNCY
jgi:NADH:ubiquinone oxidoreductase subunit